MRNNREEKFKLCHDNYQAGNTFFKAGDLNSAIKSYQEALKLKPDFIEALNNLGNALREKGDLNASIHCFEKALKLKPDFAETHYNAGITFKIKGEINKAIECFQQALKLKPNYTEAQNNLGVIFKLTGEISKAIKCFQQALKLKPDYAEAHYNLGVTFKEIGEINYAIKSYQKAIKFNPNNHNAYNNLGNILLEKSDPNAAIQYFKKALKLKPDFALAYYNIGNIYRETGDPESAILYYQKALDLKPDIVQAHYNLGISYKTKGDIISAINSYKNAIKLDPESIAAHFNLGQAIFLMGNDYRKAWSKYEYRFKKPQEPVIPHAQPSIPKWQGETLNSNEKLLVITEQGLGDTIQFMRYIPHLQKEGIKVSFCAQTKLHELIKASNIASKPLTPEKANEVKEGKWISLLSLPHFLNITPNNTLIKVPYINSSKYQISKWKKLLSTEKKPIVGINWQGNPSTELINLKGRSFPLEIFSSIAKNYDIKFLSLQKGFGSEQLEACTFKDKFVQCQDQVNQTMGFLETAAMIQNCDLVITSDTSIAHLAAGLGKLTWCLLHLVPDWRWGMEGETTFWYPSMKLFRQQVFNNWVDVIEKVAIELELLLSNK